MAKKVPTLEQEIKETEMEFAQTQEETTPIEVEQALAMKPGETSMIFQREREILDEKLVSETPEKIPFADLVWEDNVRTSKTLQLPHMIYSLKTRGYNPKYPIVVSKKSAKKFLVLCGNRRTEALKAIKESEPEIYKIILPDGKLPALVLENMTEDEEAIIRNDHSSEEDRVALDEVGEFLAIRQLVKAGYADSQADIAAKMNKFTERNGVQEPNRSYIQPRVNLARLPKTVQDEFIKLWNEGKNSTPVRISQLAKLFKLYQDGRKSGKLDGGQEFLNFWASCVHPAESDDPGEGPKSKMLTKSEVESTAGSLASGAVAWTLYKVAGNKVEDPETKQPMDFKDIDQYALRGEQALSDLIAIAEHLGKKEFDTMMGDITKKRQAEAKKSA